VLNSDDEQFEAYLKRFRPVAPQPRPIVRAPRRSLHFSTAVAWVAASAVLLILETLLLHTPERRPPVGPLTIGTANSWLAAAPSLDGALDDLASHAQSNTIPPDRQSAIAVLSAEKTKI
jgi:hypothetical protein